MPTATVEDYLKHIHALASVPGAAARSRTARGPRPRVAIGRLAEALGVTPGTVTSMVQRLSRQGLTDYERYTGVLLTAAGERAALRVLRRHRLIETFLVSTLGLDWSEVHEEAERLEHAISDKLLDRLDAFLGHPKADPHGDPIPDSRGQMPRDALVPLSRCSRGERVVIARVLDQDPGFLRFAERHGLRPGERATVHAVNASAGTIALRASGPRRGSRPTNARRITIAAATAAGLMVSRDPAPPSTPADR